MKKILPISTTPYLHSYTQHGFFHAITGTDDKVCHDTNDSIAEIIVNDFEKTEWQIESDQLNYIVDAPNKLTFKTNKWNVGMNMAFWRPCQKNDKLSVRINKQLYSNAWSAIAVFITTYDKSDLTKLNSYMISVGHFEKDGVFYSTEKGIHNRVNSGYEKPLDLTIIRENNNIYMEYKNATSSINRFKIYELNNEEDYIIGFSVNLGNNVYYEWTFSNYIQLFARPNDAIPLDYIVNVHKDWCIYTSNPLMDYHRFRKQDLEVLKITLLDFVKLQIDLENYVEMELDDVTMHGISYGELTQFFHQNLIYGYDDDKRVLNTLFYYNGRIEEGTITYENFSSEKNNGGSQFLYMMHYNPCSEHFALYTKRLIQLYKEYRDSKNMVLYEPFYEDGFMVGISCIKYFTTGEGIKNLYYDVRISYLMYEKTLCDLDRIEYLHFRNLLSKEEYEEISNLLREKIAIIEKLIKGVIKKIKGGRIKIEKLSSFLKDIEESEEKFIDRIIDVLEKE